MTAETGTVTKWDPRRGFGFIRRHGADNADIFLHIDQLIDVDSLSLRAGDRLKFTVVKTQRGLRAHGARVL